jgi:hypothetical protein
MAKKKDVDPEVDGAEEVLDPIAVSKAEVDALKLMLAEAEAQHKVVVAENTPPEPQPDYETEILVDLNKTGDYSIMKIPVGYDPRDRSIVIPGFGLVEHCTERVVGDKLVWCYRGA